jgi:hypothetical protein
MEKAGVSMIALIHAFALGVMLALASAGANAHVPENPGGDAIHGTSFAPHQYDLDCTMPAKGQHLHCHHASASPQATGPVPLDDDQPALISRPANIPAHSTDMVSAPAATGISIAGPPAFILFGNFRS